VAKINVPTDQSELEELLSDGAKVQNLMAEGQFNDVVKAYAKHVGEKDVDLAGQVKEETQRVLAEYLRDNDQGRTLAKMERGESVTRSAKDATVYNAKAAGAGIDAGQFDGVGGFLKDIWHNAYRDDALAGRLNSLRNAAASSGEPSAGGFLIPETFRAELLQLSLESGVVRSRARVIPMSGGRVLIPTVDDTSHADNVFGGVQAYWTQESGQMQDVASSFSRVALDPWKLTAFANVPNELIQDSAIAFEAYIRATFPQALSYFEDDAFINGNGAGQPLGFLNASASVTVTNTAGAGVGLTFADIVGMYSRMLPQSLNTAVWVVAPDVFPALMALEHSAGSALWYGAPGGGPQGAQAPSATLLGRPVIVSEKVPALDSAGAVNFVDLGYYLIGDRQAITVESSPHYRFQNGETSYRFVSRVDGRPWIQSALTPRNGGATLSPFVKLGAHA